MLTEHDLCASSTSKCSLFEQLRFILRLETSVEIRLMGSSESPSLSPPHLYPEELQLKLYQAFIFSIPILFSIILFLLFYLFYLKRSASTTYSATTPTNFRRTLNQATSPAPTHFDTDLKLKGDLKSKLSTVFFDDYLKTKDSLCCVCLGEFQMEEELLQVPSCKHVFHTDCIQHWLLHSNSTACPLCRSSIYLAAAYDPQQSTFHPNPVNHQDDNDQALTIAITNTTPTDNVSSTTATTYNVVTQ